MKTGSSVRRYFRVGRGVAVSLLMFAILSSGSPAPGEEITSTLVAPSQPVPVGSTIGVWLVVLNTSDHQLSRSFPPTLELRLRTGTTEQEVSAQLRDPAEASEVMIPSGGYARRQYAVTLPGGLEGAVTFSVTGVPANPVVVEVRKPQAIAAAAEGKPTMPAQTGEAFDPQEFFKDHFFGYEPFYFIAGTKSPNAKFQISFKYRLFRVGGVLVQQYPILKGFHLAYTQTSLWDLNAPSKPFLDSSYKPEFFYGIDRVDGGRWGRGFRVDLQAGVQHESNGKAGADSRSLNVAYVQPTFEIGKPGSLQFSLAPRAWAYLGSLDDNRDIARFRGYADLRASVGWVDGWQLSAIGHAGDAWDRGSLHLDLTYPLIRWFAGNLAVYLHLQYFWGYGETLLRYNDRSSSFRAGFSLFR